MDWTEHEVDVDTERIAPLHEVRDGEKLARLVANMERIGWQGRPLLVVDNGGGDYVALTGSHRHAAALEAGLGMVPVVVVSQCDRLTLEPVLGGVDVCLDGVRLYEDGERVAALRAVGNEVALALMAEEGS